LNRDVFETINAHFKSEVFKTKDNIALAEARHKVKTSLDITLKVTGQRTIWLGKEIIKRK
jgi:chromosome partitioning protein